MNEPLTPNLLRLDANLLVTLDVLLDERSVSGAARRLGLSQPAVSHALARLRALLGDPLLVRSGGRMAPTARAKALAAPLRSGLALLAQAITSPPTFDPAADEAQLRLAVLDVYATTLVPRLVHRAATAGPGLRLDVSALDMRRVWEQLRAGELDAAVIGPWAPPEDIEAEMLFEEHLRALVRADHPLVAAGRAPTAADYCAWPHVTFRITGHGAHPIDAALAEGGHARRVLARLTHFQSAAEVARTTDAVVNLPSSLALGLAARDPGLVSFGIPLPAPITYAVSMVWPRTLDAVPAQRWFRAQVRACASAVLTAAPLSPALSPAATAAPPSVQSAADSP